MRLRLSSPPHHSSLNVQKQILSLHSCECISNGGQEKTRVFVTLLYHHITCHSLKLQTRYIIALMLQVMLHFLHHTPYLAINMWNVNLSALFIRFISSILPIKVHILIGWVQFDVKSELEIELSGITFAYKWVWTFCVWHIHYNAMLQPIVASFEHVLSSWFCKIRSVVKNVPSIIVTRITSKMQLTLFV